MEVTSLSQPTIGNSTKFNKIKQNNFFVSKQVLHFERGTMERFKIHRVAIQENSCDGVG